MAAKIFIDGAVGTTGLQIRERLEGRADLSLLTLPDSQRKDAGARSAALNEADIVILCLPDDAAKEAVSLITNPKTRVIDASSAHRVATGWVFGFPEYEPGQYERIANAARVTNPGCWATGFIALVRPLVRAGLIPADTALTAHGVSGYSGGGKSMIEEFEKADSPAYVETVVRSYGMALNHKHLPEMTGRTGLTLSPVFSPSVGRFYSGMIVEIPLHTRALPGAPRTEDFRSTLEKAYQGRPLVEVAGADEAANLKTLDAELLRNTNRLKLFVFGNDKTQQLRLTAVLDNLGKGASGAAVQNLNIMLGLPETTGLV